MTYEDYNLPEQLAGRLDNYEIMQKKEWHKRLEQEFEITQKTGKQLSVIIFDVDNLKGTNDTYGHLKGDQVIKNLEQAILLVKESFRTLIDPSGDRVPDLLTKSSARDADVLSTEINGSAIEINPGRIGGDEYAALCHTDADGVEVIAKRIKHRFKTALSPDLVAIGVDISVGYCTSAPEMTVSGLLTKADEMLYQDKASHMPVLDAEQQQVIAEIGRTLRKMGVQPRHIPKYLAMYAATST